MPQTLNQERITVCKLHVEYGSVTLASKEQHVGVRVEERHQNAGGAVELQGALRLRQVADIADHDLTKTGGVETWQNKVHQSQIYTIIVFSSHYIAGFIRTN